MASGEDKLWASSVETPTADSPQQDSPHNKSNLYDKNQLVNVISQCKATADALATHITLQKAVIEADQLKDVINRKTVSVNKELDEDAFFSTKEGHTTIANRYDLEKAVPANKKTHFKEINRYWVNKPYSFIILFKSTKENEIKYYAVEPYQSEIEMELRDYVTSKLQKEIKYGDYSGNAESIKEKAATITDETNKLLSRYGLYTIEEENIITTIKNNGGIKSLLENGLETFNSTDLNADQPTADPDSPPTHQVNGIAATPLTDELLEKNKDMTEYQVEKMLYYLQRDFIGYEKIDPVKHDINVEDISCDGYNSPVFVYHTEHEQIITNIYHQETRLDDFVVKLAQRSGKGISKRQPQVDATLPDGSRAQLTLGKEVSDHGTNYTIRQFKEVPFTPIDLINWGTFSLDQMALLWLAIENEKSLIFAGGTASGKTTSLNAISLFIPSNTKIVSIEDTREVELPQRNWVASVTRPSFTEDQKGDIDEFDLLEAALRQRPDYIVMGEIRGEEGRTLFQVMSTGHTTYTTFHADSVGEVIKRFTTDPINVSKTMFSALDLVSIQTSTRVNGQKVRRSKVLTEINHYDTDNDEINVQDIYNWQAETDEFNQIGQSNVLDDIKFDQGWQQHRLEQEMFERKVVLAYLIEHGLNTYTEVAATIQAYINDSETILSLIAGEDLAESLTDLREMESVLIDIDEETEALVPRPDPDPDQTQEAREILQRAETKPLPKYENDPTTDETTTLFDIHRQGSEDPLSETLTDFIDTDGD